MVKKDKERYVCSPSSQPTLILELCNEYTSKPHLSVPAPYQILDKMIRASHCKFSVRQVHIQVTLFFTKCSDLAHSYLTQCHSVTNNLSSHHPCPNVTVSQAFSIHIMCSLLVTVHRSSCLPSIRPCVLFSVIVTLSLMTFSHVFVCLISLLSQCHVRFFSTLFVQINVKYLYKLNNMNINEGV